MGKDSKLKVEGWIIVVIFVAFLFWFFATEAKAEEGVFTEIGSTVLSGETSKGGALIIGQRFANNWSVAGGVVSEQECRCNFPADLDINIFIQGQRHVSKGPVELGIGMAYWQNTNRALGKNFTWSLHFGYNINDHWGLYFRHWSNAGSGKPNLGQDLLSLRYSFGR